MLLNPAYRRLEIDEFLAIDFGDAKAELDDGLIFMMAGGNARHAQIAGNMFAWLHQRLRGSGCLPFNSDFAVRTGPASIRYPDVSVYCGNPGDPANHEKLLLGDPKVVIEVLSRSTADNDHEVKLPEYRTLPGVDAIVLIDGDRERIRLVRRTGPAGWADDWLDDVIDVTLPSLGVTIPRSEIFALD